MLKRDRTIQIALSLLCVAAVLLLLMPRSDKFGYDYKKGHVWDYETLYAQFDFPLLKTGDQIGEDRSNVSLSAIPYYNYLQETVDENLSAAEAMDLGDLKSPVISELRMIYDRGVVGDEGVRIPDSDVVPDVIYIQRNRRATKCPSSEVLTISQARARLLSDIEGMGVEENVDSIFHANGIYALIVPNIRFDMETTLQVNRGAQNSVSPTSGYVSTGELIVANGEIVTAEIAQMLDSYKKEYETNIGYSGPKFLLWLGNGIIAIVLVLLLFIAISFTCPEILDDNRFYYILLVYLMASAGALILADNPVMVYCLVPFTLAALYLQAFFPPRVILPVYTATLLPMLVFAPNGIMLFTMYLLSGIVATYSFRTLGRGWKQFVVAVIAFCVMSLVFIGFRLIGQSGERILTMLVYLAGGSILTVFGYPLISLFEKIFNLVSNSRLREFCDTSNALLRDLEQKAPGTFQHSLQVMNMADTAARAIGANALLVSAGALYHDIGKMNNPQCFIENESLLQKSEEEKYHHSLEPIESSHDIIRHVTDGIELAQRHHLPDVLTDFIRTHHGTSTTGYFYQKFLQNGGDPARMPEFCYPGSKPATKEQIILMLCDSIEAGSRSMQEHTPEAYAQFVNKIVGQKRGEGQLDDADISLKELNIIKDAIKNHLLQMHHGRIAYPERTGQKNKSKYYRNRL